MLGITLRGYMKILFIGAVVNKELEKANPAVSTAGNNFQIGFLGELKQCCKVKVLTQITKAAWPSGSELFDRKICGKLFEDLKFETIPYINIRLLKEVTVMLSVAKSIINFCRQNKGEKCYIISYNGNGPFSVPILALRKIFHYKYVCMVVDPPLYQGTTTRTGFMYGILYKAMARSFYRAALKCDDCVVLNAYYAEEYLHRKDYFVLDCGVALSEEKLGCTDTDIDVIQYWDPTSPRKHIVFTGTLHEHSGILRFIEMFHKIGNENFELHIWGKGIFEENIRRIASETDHIFFHGFMANDKVKKIQKKADFLLCPNTIEHPINKVAFPSKIQEYMMSGVPVIATKVNGLGKDYYEHLYLYDDTLVGLKKIFTEIERDGIDGWKIKGQGAKEFIMQQKNWNKQVERMMSYLSREQETCKQQTT